jgi:hypothetical protein
MERHGEQFLHQKESSLHTSKPVEHEKVRKKIKGEKTSQRPADKIADWLKVVERTHMGHRDDPRVLERIKGSYHREHVIKPEDIPEAYFDNQRRLARERGEGDIEITDEMRFQHAEVIVSDQESTLDNWVEYLSSEDSDSFPTWAKYWAFKGMLKLSTYDKEKHAFGKRDKGTVAPFSDLNREALAYTVDAIVKKINKEDIPEEVDDPDFQKLLQGANFGKIYVHEIEKVTPAEENELLTTTGEWIKYDQGSDHMPLVESLQGHGTGWCTAGETTAKSQLESGDFYVYYSHDKQGGPTVPRVAVRMNDNSIAEVRGIAHEQNLDPYIADTDILDEKLKEFPDGESYKKKTADMKRLTEIDTRNTAGGEPTKDDLRFLYEIDSRIQGFGYGEDSRIKEIIDKRDVRADISFVTGFSKEQISTTKEEVLKGGIKHHYGDLRLNQLKYPDGLVLPETVGGDLYLDSLTSADGLVLPKTIGGDLRLNQLKYPDGLALPKTVGGDLGLDSLTSADGLVLPETVGGDLSFWGLTSADGLVLPETVGGDLYLDSLTSADGLVLPKTIGGDLYLSQLKYTDELEFPETVGGTVELNVSRVRKMILRERYPKLNFA